MPGKGLFALFFLTCWLPAQAQKPVAILANWSDRSPVEKAYLHFDRDNYFAGETAWFKAYLYADNFPDTISTSLYIELLDQHSNVLIRKVQPVFFGAAKGQLELPDSLFSGTYFIRAYSPTMLNQPADFIYRRAIFVYGEKKDAVPPPASRDITIHFFPEGGNLVGGLVNTVAVKATDAHGLPVMVEGIVKNQKGEKLAAFNSYHDGMSSFDLTPVPGEKYSVEVKGMELRSYEMPETVARGVVLRVMPDRDGKYYEIFQHPGDPDFLASYMIGQMNNRVVFKKEFNHTGAELNGAINTKQLGSGILQLTVFNSKDVPLAERIVFVDNKEYMVAADLIADTLSFAAKGSNQLTLVLKDSVVGTLSVAITDPDYDLMADRNENIVSRLLFSADIKGYVHQPAWYFRADPDSAKNALDLVMMTNGWRRFKWSELLKNPPSGPAYHDPGFITINGQVTIRDRNKPLAEKDLMVLIKGEDSSGNKIEALRTDPQGRFQLDSLVFYGKTSFYLNDIGEKKSKWLDVKPGSDSIRKRYPLPLLQDQGADQYLFEKPLPGNWARSYDEIQKAAGQLLDEVVIKVKNKNPEEKVEERYTSGAFTGSSQHTIDLVNSTETISQLNIFDYLQGRVPGVQIFRNGTTYTLNYRQARSLLGGPIPMTLFLDEIQTSADIIATIPANQIAMVKVFSSFIGAEGNAPGGVLAVYTKKGEDMSSALSSSGDFFSYNGYSVVKEFYSPDYIAEPATKTKTDNRITLQWIPYLLMDGKNLKIPIRFFNNDRTKRYKVVIEGMTFNGQLLMLEKIISPKPF